MITTNDATVTFDIFSTIYYIYLAPQAVIHSAIPISAHESVSYRQLQLI